jgi:hypothetical protein
VFREIRRRFPSATIFVTPLPEFEEPSTCPKQDIPDSIRLVNEIVSRTTAVRGPDLPTVLAAWIEDGDHGCHVGPIGSAAFGAALQAFNWEVK